MHKSSTRHWLFLISAPMVAALVQPVTTQAQIVPMQKTECVADCGECCLGLGSELFTGGDEEYWNYPYECECFTHCPNKCLLEEEEDSDGLEAEDLAALLEAAASGDMAIVSRLIATRSQIHLNTQRHAVQVTGRIACSGGPTIVAHIPLTLEQHAAVKQQLLTVDSL